MTGTTPRRVPRTSSNANLSHRVHLKPLPDDGLLSDGDDEMDADEVEFNRVLDQRAARDARSNARAVGNS